MADFTITGYMRQVKYLEDSCIVYVDEFKKGYRKSNGEVVDDKYYSWRIIFKGYFKKYINEHFNTGMLVQIKGEVFPYAMENGSRVSGYSVMGQTINVASYPRLSSRMEALAIKDSQLHVDEEPDFDGYNTSDFQP